VDAVDAEAVTVVPQVVVTTGTVTVAVVAVVVVAVVVAVVLIVVVPRALPSIELQSLEESAIFIGPLEPVTVDLTVLSNTKQSPRRWHPSPQTPHRLQKIFPTFSP
jgi:hypothetical protein